LKKTESGLIVPDHVAAPGAADASIEDKFATIPGEVAKLLIQEGRRQAMLHIAVELQKLATSSKKTKKGKVSKVARARQWGLIIGELRKFAVNLAGAAEAIPELPISFVERQTIGKPE
jgi:hypothetical protein